MDGKKAGTVTCKSSTGVWKEGADVFLLPSSQQIANVIVTRDTLMRIAGPSVNTALFCNSIVHFVAAIH